MNHFLLLLILSALFSATCQAHYEDDAPVERPKIFLDKSPRIVQYQLKRLDNRRLLLVERSVEDQKYIPVFEAILNRPGIDRKNREESLGALVLLRKTDAVTELLRSIQSLKRSNTEEKRLASDMARMLLSQPIEHLQMHQDALEATAEESGFLRQVGFAARIVAGQFAQSVQEIQEDSDAQTDWLDALKLIPAKHIPQQASTIVEQFLRQPEATEEVITAGILSFASLPTKPAEIFEFLKSYLASETLRPYAVKTLLKFDLNQIDPDSAESSVASLISYGSQTPAAKRTTEAFLEAMQLAETLLVSLPVEKARTYRAQIREYAVRVVTIHTVEEEMRYDLPYFAAQAGKPIQILLKNEDLMPHNLVFTKPGSLQKVAEEGLQAGPENGLNGMPYVPKSDDVLEATEMIEAHQQIRLTFTAPSEPGEYPYVCTFPRHWMRMYGVMVVVKDLEAWQRNPVAPKDPIGSNRSFVKSWTVEDLSENLEQNLRGRTARIGRKIYEEATCLQCHQVSGEGGKVGPELTDVFTRWKGDHQGILREILDPSHKIDEKYSVQMVIDTNGKTASGIVVKEDDDHLYLLDNPEAKQPKKILQDDILEVVKTPTSMMPKGLLDRFTQDEIYELLAYLQNLSPQKSPQ